MDPSYDLGYHPGRVHILQVDTINAPIGLYSGSQYSDHIQYSVPNIVDD